MEKDRSRNYQIVILFIVLIAGVLRFARYSDRWGLAYDQTHDAIIAHYAVENLKLPLVGPFSSGGPFQTSGVWYWFIMAGYLLNFSHVMSPWIVLTTLYVIGVYAMIHIGSVLVGRRFGLLVGILSAVSTAEIAQAVNLTNQSPLALTSTAALLTYAYGLKTKRLRWLFFTACFVSLGASIHLQGMALLPLIIAAVVVWGKLTIKSVLIVVFGLLLPWFPIILFDISNDWTTISHMIQYILYDQQKISLDVLGRNWRTFIGVFLPYEWSHIVGGRAVLGAIQMGLVIVIGGLHLFTKKLPRSILGLLIAFVGSVILLRYTRAPLFSSYVVFLHPIILLLSSYALYQLIKLQKVIGVVLLFLILGGSLIKDKSEIEYGTNLSAAQGTAWSYRLTTLFPNQQFSVYDFQYYTGSQSLLLSLYLDAQRKISNNGKKIGVLTKQDESIHHPLLFEDVGFQFVDLDSSTSAELSDGKWLRVNPEDVYNSTQNWKK